MLSAAFLLPLLLIAIAQFFPISDAIDCFSCASPALHNQWEATGLPAIPPPDRFAFHACDGTGTDYKPCADVCMEMLVAAGNEYGVVRGCMSDFYHGQTTSANTDKCYFGEYPHNVTIYDPTNGAKTYSQLYMGVRYCSTVNGACNNKFVPKKEAAEGSGAFADTICRQTQQLPTTACLSCSRHDSAGDCNSNWKETCQGQWCTKTTGYVNGRWMESRGCAPFNPSGNSMCVKTESEHTFDLFDNHPLQMPYSLERCYCQGAHCNGAIHSIGANFVPIWWPFFVLIGIFGAKFSM
ncbi:hypothetical protein niasHT_009779 [Heterodera trifolii]|uniref:Uncharacterized protein n=1 Tax=Heterodera trifolii TaxID=157864 RepID=A0ABD2MDS7_9BILA